MYYSMIIALFGDVKMKCTQEMQSWSDKADSAEFEGRVSLSFFLLT